MGYPSQYEAEVLLKDGSRIILRPIRSDDIKGWLGFVSRLSRRTKYLRFHSLPKLGREEAIRFCTVDYNDTFAFVAEVRRDQRKDIVAIGRYYRLPKRHSAEIAFTVEDAYQGKGIGTKLMEWLTNVARENGITTFEAAVLGENNEIMTVFRDYGFHITGELQSGVYHITFPIARTKRVVKKEEERKRVATVASLSSLLYPRCFNKAGHCRADHFPVHNGKQVFRSGLPG